MGHDNNRDGYMNNMLESRDVTRTELEWDPVIFYCHHQTAPFPTRIFIPPFTEPISSNIHPLMARWLNVLGIDMAAYLDEHGMPGAVHRVGFDNWYPGFLDFTHIFRNSISFFTETALYSYATPHFYSVNDFPRDRQGLRSEIFYSSPWKGGWWRLGDAVRYMLGASMSVLDTAAKYRETLLYNRYQAARDNIERFRQEPPYAYVIPQEQRDPPTAAILVDKLLTNGIEVHQAAQPFAANGREYANAWVVLMDQPFSPLVKELFEPQVWPDLRATPNGAPQRPYDVAGWTLPMQMGVEVASVLKPVTAAAACRAAANRYRHSAGGHGAGNRHRFHAQPQHQREFQSAQRSSRRRRAGELCQGRHRALRHRRRARRRPRAQIRGDHAGRGQSSRRCRRHQEAARSDCTAPGPPPSMRAGRAGFSKSSASRRSRCATAMCRPAICGNASTPS